MYTKNLKSAVVGLGIGVHHALAILANSSCHLSRIVELDQQKAKNFIAKYPLTKIINSNFDDVINDKEIGLVSIASFDDAHHEQVKSTLKANKNVFVEKPLCQTKAQLREIHQIFLEKSDHIGISSNLVLRTAELYKYIKILIQDGKLGEIYAFDGDYLYGRINKITEGWRKNIDNYSVMAGGGIHMIDLMIWLTGQKPLMVSSCVNKISTKNFSFRYHDFHSAIISFQSGLIGRITANFGCMHKHQHVVRIFGTKGTFIYDDMGPRVHWNRDESSSPEFIQLAAKPSTKALLIDEFV